MKNFVFLCALVNYFKKIGLNFAFHMKQKGKIIWPQQDFQALVFLVCLVLLLLCFDICGFCLPSDLCCLLDTFTLQVINVNSPVSAVYTNLQLILPSCQTKETSSFKSTVYSNGRGLHPKHIVNHVRPTESHSFLTADVKEQWIIKRLRPYRVGGGDVIVALHCG